MAENDSKTAAYPVGYKKPPVNTRFQPGHAPLPGAGRPRNRPQSEASDDFLRMEIPEPWRKAMNKVTVDGRPTTVEILKPGATFADAIAYGLGKKAMTGDAVAAKELREAVEGKATQRFEFTPTDSGIAQFAVVYANGIPGKELPPDESKVIDVVPEKPDGEEPK
jgi:hypothetical protein